MNYYHSITPSLTPLHVVISLMSESELIGVRGRDPLSRQKVVVTLMRPLHLHSLTCKPSGELKFKDHG